MAKKTESKPTYLAEAEALALGARKVLVEAQERYHKEAVEPKLRALVGKCFKCRNCYSCPEKESDYWWLYLCITGIDAEGAVEGVKFQTDKNGKLKVEQETLFMHDGTMQSGYVEITDAEFKKAVNALRANVERLLLSEPTP